MMLIIIMGNSEDKQESRLVEHSRFRQAKLTVDKKMVLEFKHAAPATELAGKIRQLPPQHRAGLLLPQIEETLS